MAGILVLCGFPLSGCEPAPAKELARPPANTTPVASSYAENLAQRAADTVVESTHETVAAVIDTLPLPPVPVGVPQPALMSPTALDMIVAGEVGSRSAYRQKYQRPVWPGGVSGATIGIGYDLGMTTGEIVGVEWVDHPQLARLRGAAGLHGTRGRDITRTLRDVETLYPLAYSVFRDRSVVKYYRMTRRAFPGMERLPKNAQGALVSLVYNRGSGMTGSKREEMRTLRDHCVPAGDVVCIARQLEGMARHWVGTSIEYGMKHRRYAEAALALRPDTA